LGTGWKACTTNTVAGTDWKACATGTFLGGTGFPACAASQLKFASPPHEKAISRPVEEFRITRRNLPHWRAPGATYFVTWRVRRGRLLAETGRTVVLNALRFWDGRKWAIYSCVVMPDHVHALVRPLPLDLDDPLVSGCHDLSALTQSVKGFSAREVNKLESARGALWQDESYDRIMRGDREFDEAWAYIVANPVKAELCERPEDYQWLYCAGRAD
jgi:REP element-mobilizing transposase RayT